MRLLSIIKRKAMLTAGLVVVLSAFGFATAGTALAGPVVAKVGVSTSASCSSKNGVATVKITAKGTTKGGATIDSVSIDVNSGAYQNSGATQASVTITPASGNYTGVIFVDGSPNDVTQYAIISAGNGKCSVKVTSTPPV
jgi:hypothetical protein